MRRAAILLCLAVVLSSCATPDFRLTPRFAAGEVREYRLVADAVVRINAAATSQVERSRLIATTRLDVESITAGVTTILLTITPRSLTRDGKAADLPAEQQVRMKVGADGRVTEVSPVGGQAPTLEASDVEDLVPLIGPPLPPGRVHLADRWTRRSTGTQSGTQAARLASLRHIDDYDCAIVATSTRRPVTRERELGGSTLRLEGVEFASGEIAFAFRQGFPVSVRSDAEARLAVSGAGASGGGVVITTKTALTLTRRTTR
ncbi:MAG: hypothetical protein WAT66_16280 [Actinomycetota bacterium]